MPQTAELSAENVGERVKERGGLAINVETESAVFRTHCSSSGCPCIDSIDVPCGFLYPSFVPFRLYSPGFSRGEALRSLNGTLSLLRYDLPLNSDIYPLVAAACCNDRRGSTMIMTLMRTYRNRRLSLLLVKTELSIDISEERSGRARPLIEVLADIRDVMHA